MFADKTTKVLSGLVLLAIVASAIGLSWSKQTTTQPIEVPTSNVLPISAGSLASPMPKKKVLNLNLNPENVLFFNSEVNASSVEAAIARIQENERKGEDLNLVLDCPGGEVFAGSRLISYMESAKIKVNTIVYGMAASMCAHIHAHGAKRYVLDRSTLMYHSAAGVVQGTVPQMRALLDYVDLETQKLDAYIAQRSGLKREDFAQLTLKNLWISGEDAVNMGLADGLVTVSVRGESLVTIPDMENNIIKQHKEIIGTLDKNQLKNFR